jgi:DNA-binding CsgD family transcriptional regulator
MVLAKSSKRTLLIVYIASGVGLLAIILILILMLKLEKQKKQKTEAEKNGLHEKLEFQNKELTTNVVYLSKMNELVLAIAEKLKKLDLSEGSPNSRIIQSVISELEQTSNTETWKEFEMRFQNVHVDFYKKLGEQFPDLTPNELKLCAFMRLNMSTKEISALTYQSQNSITVARSRLRQKLGVTKDENLINFLSQI